MVEATLLSTSLWVGQVPSTSFCSLGCKAEVVAGPSGQAITFGQSLGRGLEVDSRLLGAPGEVQAMSKVLSE